MHDPYSELGLSHDADDETIRRRYLELVRENPPEQQPARFATIRAAYEKLKDLDTRLKLRLFDLRQRDGIDELIEDVSCRMPRRRYSLQTLLTMQRTQAR